MAEPVEEDLEYQQHLLANRPRPGNDPGHRGRSPPGRNPGHRDTPLGQDPGHRGRSPQDVTRKPKNLRTLGHQDKRQCRELI